MGRPTIKDLAIAADVSVSTVNRILRGADQVRRPTLDRVREAAEQIGFYGLGSIDSAVQAQKETHRFGILLQQKGRIFYEELAQSIRHAAEAVTDARIILDIEYMKDLVPESVADQIVAMGKRNDALAVVAPEHPIIVEAINQVTAGGVTVTALISPILSNGNVGYVGLDHWKVGRTAAWAFHNLSRRPGKIGILVGHHRFKNQDQNESGFRSYFRENATEFSLLDAVTTFESASVARDLTSTILRDNPDLSGLFISGGGITGALSALREGPRPEGLIVVGYELIPPTRAALLDGTMNLCIAHPLVRMGQTAIATMIKAKKAGVDAGIQRATLPFDICTPENI